VFQRLFPEVKFHFGGLTFSGNTAGSENILYGGKIVMHDGCFPWWGPAVFTHDRLRETTPAVEPEFEFLAFGRFAKDRAIRFDPGFLKKS